MTTRKQALIQAQPPTIVFQPQTYYGLQQGINQIAEAIKPTLGPRPRHVAMERIARTQSPELLDKGALIARRITGLSHADAEMGAMLLRQMLWQQYEAVGDGTAAAAVLFQSLFNDGVKYITAGGNAMRLRSSLLAGLQCILTCLSQQKIVVQGRTQIKQVALTLSHDHEMAETLSEVFDVLGEYGRIEVRSGQGRGLAREYVHGIYWESGVYGQVDKTAKKTYFERCAIFVSDLEFDDPRTLLPIITAATARAQALVIVASKLSERAIGLLAHINKTSQHFQVTAVKTPTAQMARIHMLEELGRITRARTYLQVAQEDIHAVQPHDLGSAEQIWANEDYFCVVEDADGGHHRAEYLTELHHRYQNALEDDQRAILRERIGRLMGASATLLVGGLTRADIDARKEEIKGIVSCLRSCLEQGIIPGGGVAFLNCQAALKRKRQSAQDSDEHAAYKMLASALEMPMRQILTNAGVEVGAVLGQIRNKSNGSGYDVITGQIRSMKDAGIVDSAAVAASALERAVRTAALALTVDVLVHHRNPEVSANP